MIEHRTWFIDPYPYTRVLNRGKPSAAARRYQAFRTECAWKKVWQPTPGDICVFTLAMPKSWSRRKRDELAGEPHEQKPDADNLVKGLIDAVYQEDKGVWGVEGYKFWNYAGSITIIRTEPRFRTLDDVIALIGSE